MNSDPAERPVCLLYAPCNCTCPALLSVVSLLSAFHLACKPCVPPPARACNEHREISALSTQHVLHLLKA